jgi:hypothetical protein
VTLLNPPVGRLTCGPECASPWPQLWIVSVAEVLATARIADRYAASGTARHSLGLVV